MARQAHIAMNHLFFFRGLRILTVRRCKEYCVRFWIALTLKRQRRTSDQKIGEANTRASAEDNKDLVDEVQQQQSSGFLLKE